MSVWLLANLYWSWALSIFTGTTPSVHGIIANDWYDKNTGEYIYCAGDGDMHTICNCEKNNVDIISKDGKMSPHRMLTTTFSDELKLFNDNSKVIGISLKDRGAILPAGHSSDAKLFGWIVRENGLHLHIIWISCQNMFKKLMIKIMFKNT